MKINKQQVVFTLKLFSVKLPVVYSQLSFKQREVEFLTKGTLECARVGKYILKAVRAQTLPAHTHSQNTHNESSTRNKIYYFIFSSSSSPHRPATILLLNILEKKIRRRIMAATEGILKMALFSACHLLSSASFV
jgi:hypothetical protein